MHLLSQAFAHMLLQKYFSFVSFRKYDFTCFRKLQANSQISFCSVGKLLKFMVSQGFARIRKESQMDFRRDLSRIRKCENHGF